MLRQESLPVSLSNVMGLMIRYLSLHFLLITYWCTSRRWTLLESMSRKVLCPAQIFRNTLFAIFFGQIWFCYSTKYKSNWKLKGTGHLAHNLLLMAGDGDKIVRSVHGWCQDWLYCAGYVSHSHWSAKCEVILVLLGYHPQHSLKENQVDHVLTSIFLFTYISNVCSCEYQWQCRTSLFFPITYNVCWHVWLPCETVTI